MTNSKRGSSWSPEPRSIEGVALRPSLPAVESPTRNQASRYEDLPQQVGVNC